MARWFPELSRLGSRLRSSVVAGAAAILGLAGGFAGAAEDPGAMPIVPGAAKDPNFQPYVFWAYGAVCLFLFLFTLFTLLQARRVETKIDYLEGRLRRAEGNPERGPPG